MSEAPILDGIHRVPDMAAAGDFENKHTPAIDCVREGDQIHVHMTIGHGVIHPNQADHFIEWFELLINDAPAGRFTFGAVVGEPDVTCVLNGVEAGAKITAFSSCNLHGLWAWDVTAP